MLDPYEKAKLLHGKLEKEIFYSELSTKISINYLTKIRPSSGLY